MKYTHQQINYFRRIIFYFFLLILTIAFIATIGIKFLINLTLFIADITHPKIENSLSESKNSEFLFPPEILEIPTATNSSKIKISGKATKGKNLSLFINNQLKEKIFLENDSFEIEVNLPSFKNSLYFILEDPKTKEKKQSNIYQVIYKKEKPNLEIISPKDQEKINQEEIIIVGKTDKEVLVKINDLPAVVSVTGQFSHPLKLHAGENKIIVTATDIAGNQKIKELTVIYQKDQ